MAFRIIFFGSSEFAAPALRALARDHDVIAVYTQPDKHAGRHLQLRPTPIKQAAASLGLDVFTPEKLDSAFGSLVEGLHPELLVCAAYGKILPRVLLETPGMSALNVHPSLLPSYRGAAPIQAALRDGATETGATIMWMSAEMDAGDIALARAVTIDPEDDFGSLHDRLAQVAAEVLTDAIARLATGTLTRMPQDHSRATYAAPIRNADRQLNFDRPAEEVVNVVRSLSPKPSAWTIVNDQRLKVLRARAETQPVDVKSTAPGTILALEGEGPLVACASGAIRLLRIVPAGRQAMSGAEFVRGLPNELTRRGAAGAR